MSKPCLICGEPFEARGNKKLCSNCGVGSCEACGKSFPRKPKNRKRFCSGSCAQGASTTKEKIKETQGKIYGGIGFQVRNTWESFSPEQQRQRVENLRKARKPPVPKAPAPKVSREETLRKISESNRVTWRTTPQEVKVQRAEKQRQARLRFLENETPEQRRKRVEAQKQGLAAYWKSLTPEAKEELITIRQNTLSASEKKRISSLNKAWAQTLSQRFGVEVTFEKNVGTMNYDLVIGNLLIDVNPTVSHNVDISFAHFTKICSQENCEKHKPLAKNYHLERARNAHHHGYDWFFIFDHLEREKVLDMLGAKLRKSQHIVAGRKTSVEEISPKVARGFINDYHLLGERRNAPLNLGLYQGNELLSVMSFRELSSGSWELKRFVSKGNTTILGGPEKLFKAFLRRVEPREVITYADYNFGAGKLYNRLGFELLKAPRATPFWLNLKSRSYLNNNSLLLGADRVLPSWAKREGREFFPVGKDYRDFELRGGLQEYRELYKGGVLQEGELPTNEMIARHYGFMKLYDAGYQTFRWRMK